MYLKAYSHVYINPYIHLYVCIHNTSCISGERKPELLIAKEEEDEEEEKEDVTCWRQDKVSGK